MNKQTIANKLQLDLGKLVREERVTGKVDRNLLTDMLHGVGKIETDGIVRTLEEVSSRKCPEMIKDAIAAAYALGVLSLGAQLIKSGVLDKDAMEKEHAEIAKGVGH